MFDWLITLRLKRIARRADPDRRFVVALEKRLKAEMGYGRRATGWKTALATFSSLAVLFGGTGAYAYASENVLPGDLLYPVREGLERAEERLAFTPELKMLVNLRHLTKRVREQQLSLERGKPVTEDHARRFVTEMESALETASSIDETERAELDETIAGLERTYANILLQARSRELTEAEQERIDAILDRQTDELRPRVQDLNPERRAYYRDLLERRVKVLDRLQEREHLSGALDEVVDDLREHFEELEKILDEQIEVANRTDEIVEEFDEGDVPDEISAFPELNR